MKSESTTKNSWLLDGLILLLALGGFSISLLLLVRRFSDVNLPIAGCGSGADCAEILSSRWSEVFGLPVSAFGLLVYLGLMFSMTKAGTRLFIPMLGAILGAAAWLVFAQAIFLQKFCPWCMSAHGIGCVVVLLGLFRLGREIGFLSALGKVFASGLVAFFVIGLSQLYGPSPAGHRVDSLQAPEKPSSASIHSRGEGRLVKFSDGTLVCNVTELPHLGPVDAKHVLVEYFDYQCPACRKMAGYLDALMEKHPADVSVILLPVPLDGNCNSALDPSDPGHPGSCDIARLALAVWRSNPDGYVDFHRALLTGLSLEEARVLAERTVPPEKLSEAMADPWISELIQADVADWVRFSASVKQLPKLLVTGRRILHGLPSGEEDFIRVMEKELGL